MRRSKVLWNRESFVTNTPSIEVLMQNIDKIVMGLEFLQAGAGAPTLATIVPFSTLIKLTVGGEVVTLIRSDDLWVLNHIWGNIPFFLLPAGDNQAGQLVNLKLPVELTTDKTVRISLKDDTPATIDTETLTVTVKGRDKLYNARSVSLKAVSGTVASTFKEVDMSNAGKSLIGLLAYLTTIPVVDAGTPSHDATIGELKVLIKRDEKAHFTLDDMDIPPFNTEETTGLGVADNYRFLDFKDEPYPADKLKISVVAWGTLTDAFRLVGIYR